MSTMCASTLRVSQDLPQKVHSFVSSEVLPARLEQIYKQYPAELDSDRN